MQRPMLPQLGAAFLFSRGLKFGASIGWMMRPVIAGLPASKIREVANAGLGRSDVLAFWFGESDEATPSAVNEAAITSLRAGETFYSHNLGLPDLREALAAHLSDLHGTVVTPERIAVASSGVSALMIASQLLVSPGDEVVAVVQHHGAARHPGCASATRVLARSGRCLDAGPARVAACDHAADACGADQRPEQPHGLDADA